MHLGSTLSFPLNPHLPDTHASTFGETEGLRDLFAMPTFFHHVWVLLCWSFSPVAATGVESEGCRVKTDEECM